MKKPYLLDDTFLTSSYAEVSEENFPDTSDASPEELCYQIRELKRVVWDLHERLLDFERDEERLLGLERGEE